MMPVVSPEILVALQQKADVIRNVANGFLVCGMENTDDHLRFAFLPMLCASLVSRASSKH